MITRMAGARVSDCQVHLTLSLQIRWIQVFVDCDLLAFEEVILVAEHVVSTLFDPILISFTVFV